MSRYVDDAASESTVRPTPHKFRFNAQRVLLTYPQCGELTREDVLYTLLERYPTIDEYCVAEESHADSGRHIHCVLKFRTKVNLIGSDIFDVNDGVDIHHPNIKTVQRGKANWTTVCEYVSKEDPAPLTNIAKVLTWEEIDRTAQSAEHFLELVRKNYPREFLLNLQRYEYAAKRLFTNCVNTIPMGWEPEYEHTVPGELSYLEELPDKFAKTLVITGPPGCGKTTWAKEWAPKPALFVRHLDSLARFRPEHRSIIFDDLDFRHLPPSTQKYLVDYENLAEVHIRYNVARIPAGVPRIVTANEYPFTEEGVHGDAINRRVNKIFL